MLATLIWPNGFAVATISISCSIWRMEWLLYLCLTSFGIFGTLSRWELQWENDFRRQGKAYPTCKDKRFGKYAGSVYKLRVIQNDVEKDKKYGYFDIWSPFNDFGRPDTKSWAIWYSWTLAEIPNFEELSVILVQFPVYNPSSKVTHLVGEGVPDSL